MCELCRGDFNVDDEIIKTTHGYFHDEDCFYEYAFNQLSAQSLTFEEFEEETK